MGSSATARQRGVRAGAGTVRLQTNLIRWRKGGSDGGEAESRRENQREAKPLRGKADSFITLCFFPPSSLDTFFVCFFKPVPGLLSMQSKEIKINSRPGELSLLYALVCGRRCPNRRCSHPAALFAPSTASRRFLPGPQSKKQAFK